MSTQPSPSTEPEPSTTSESTAADREDVQARFRAALERKRSRHAAGASGAGDSAKSQSTHGAAGTKRVFRRKSG